MAACIYFYAIKLSKTIDFIPALKNWVLRIILTNEKNKN